MSTNLREENGNLGPTSHHKQKSISDGFRSIDLNVTDKTMKLLQDRIFVNFMLSFSEQRVLMGRY